MSDFNPYMDICICDPYGAQNIACVAVFHHSDDPCENDELGSSNNDGQEHDDFVILSLPTPISYRPYFFLNFLMKVLEKIPLGYNKTQLKFLFSTFTRYRDI